jgi:LysM domain
MSSLTAHLRETGDHGRLPFHPSCPVCRQERLYGTLSSEPVVPRRAQALFASGVLAFSASAPAVSIAQEPDRQFEGVVAPEEPGGTELDDPTFDPGGETALSFDTAPAPSAPEDGLDTGDGAPLDVEPTVDLDARLAPLADTGAEVSEEESAVAPAEPVAPGGPGSLGPGLTAGTDAPSPGAAPPGPAPQLAAPAPPDATTQSGGTGESPDADASPRLTAQADAWRARDAQAHNATRARYTHTDVRPDEGAPASSQRVSDGAGATSGHSATQVIAAPAPAVAGATGASSTAADPPAAVDQPPLDSGARFHVVQPGDSLWSIAKRLLGPNASAGRIAREVNRLWTLNSSRIATGDPDLLMVGTRLELR